MDYTTLTKKEVFKLKELSNLLHGNFPVVTVKKPNGEQYDEIWSNSFAVWWEELDNYFTEEEKAHFVKNIMGFQIGLPWYRDSKIGDREWKMDVPFSRIEPDMIDFCLEQRERQIKNNNKGQIQGAIWGAFFSLVFPVLFKLLYFLLYLNQIKTICILTT